MESILNNAWNFEYAIFPCLVAYLVFDLPIIYRRITRRVYAPIYFAFFPFGYSDELYGRYINDDDYDVITEPINESEVTNVRYKIIWISVLSLALTMAISPFVAALFSHYVLTTAQQFQFFYTLAIAKGVMLAWALYDLKWQHKITTVVPMKYLAIIYVLYWIALLTFYDRALDWIVKKDNIGGLFAIFQGLLDFFVYDIGVGILFFGIIGFLLPWRLTSGTAQPIKEDELLDEI